MREPALGRPGNRVGVVLGVTEPDSPQLVRFEEEVDVRLVRRAREVVRIRKRIVTEEQTFTVTTRREELVVERRPAAEPGSSSDHAEGALFDRVFTLSAEEAVIQTRVVPRERVRVWVEPVVEHRTVSGTLRGEEVELEGEESAGQA